MQEYLSWAKRLQPGFDFFSLSHVPRSGNTHVDSLATLATSSARDLPRIILVEHLDRANEVAKGMVHVHEVRVGPSWMDPMVRFLKGVVHVPGHIYCVSTLRHQNYCLKSCTKGSAGVTQEEVLLHQAITQGYWWPGMQKEALEYVKKCDQCQRFALNIHQPGGILNPLSSPWPFA